MIQVCPSFTASQAAPVSFFTDEMLSMYTAARTAATTMRGM